MTHMIDMSNNRANMAYVGMVPWHGLGQKIDEDATIEEWRIAAGLDWEIEKRKLYYTKMVNGKKIPHVVEDRVALVRSDTQEHLSIMSDGYNVVQPEDILEFYRELVDGSQFRIETAGSLKNGAKIWALARGNLDLRVQGQDLIKPYLLLATTCDGSMSTVSDFTTICVVCNNTLTAAVGTNGEKAGIRIPHSRKFDPNEVKRELGLLDDQFETFAQDVDTLADKKMKRNDVIEFFVDQYAKLNEDGEVENERHVKAVAGRLIDLYDSGPGADLRSRKNTAWGMVNAITHYEDFDAKAHNNGNRFNSSQFGRGARRKKAAFNNALEMAA